MSFARQIKGNRIRDFRDLAQRFGLPRSVKSSRPAPRPFGSDLNCSVSGQQTYIAYAYDAASEGLRSKQI